MSVFDETKRSIEAADHLTEMDQGAMSTLLKLARAIDAGPGEGKIDNVSMPTYLKFCSELGLTPAGREKLQPKAKEAGGKLGQLRSIRPA
jgi:hypothetical protein